MAKRKSLAELARQARAEGKMQEDKAQAAPGSVKKKATSKSKVGAPSPGKGKSRPVPSVRARVDRRLAPPDAEDRGEKPIRLNVNLEPEVYRALRGRAKALGVSLSELVRALVGAYLDDE